MTNYPTYYPQTNNVYNQQFQNPYQQRMDFLQSYQQSLQQPVQMQQPQQMNVIGKIVDGIESVKVMDVPMDGNVYYFPKADGSEIYGKHWIVNEGRTRILTFKPLLEADSNTLSNEAEKAKIDPIQNVTDVFTERFDRLENRINELMTKSMTKTPTSRTKKESDSE